MAQVSAEKVDRAENDSLQKRLMRLFANSPIAGPLVTLIVIYILFLFIVPNFATWRTLSGIITAVSISGIVTIGITLLMISGEFDLSLAPMIAMSGYLFGSVSVGADNLITQTLASIGIVVGDGNIPLAIALGLGVPALMGLVNGLILVWTNIPSFIVTLGTRQIYRGLVWIVAGAELLQVLDEPAIFGILNGRLDGFNDFIKNVVLDPESRDRVNFRTATLWLLALVGIYQMVLVRTRFGNHIFAVGGNDGAAKAQGVRNNRTRLYAFIISGLLAGFAGMVQFSQFKSVRVAEQTGIELTAIAGAVVGGALLNGGYGSVWGALIGVTLISVLRSGVILLKIPFVPADNFPAVVGVTIIASVVLNNYLRTRSTS
ncbi:MAG: ABC transporter permease [Chloroflexota bacterium]